MVEMWSLKITTVLLLLTNSVGAADDDHVLEQCFEPLKNSFINALSEVQLCMNSLNRPRDAIETFLQDRRALYDSTSFICGEGMMHNSACFNMVDLSDCNLPAETTGTTMQYFTDYEIAQSIPGNDCRLKEITKCVKNTFSRFCFYSEGTFHIYLKLFLLPVAAQKSVVCAADIRNILSPTSNSDNVAETCLTQLSIEFYSSSKFIGFNFLDYDQENKCRTLAEMKACLYSKLPREHPFIQNYSAILEGGSFICANLEKLQEIKEELMSFTQTCFIFSYNDHYEGISNDILISRLDASNEESKCGKLLCLQKCLNNTIRRHFLNNDMAENFFNSFLRNSLNSLMCSSSEANDHVCLEMYATGCADKFINKLDRLHLLPSDIYPDINIYCSYYKDAVSCCEAVGESGFSLSNYSNVLNSFEYLCQETAKQQTSGINSYCDSAAVYKCKLSWSRYPVTHTPAGIIETLKPLPDKEICSELNDLEYCINYVLEEDLKCSEKSSIIATYNKFVNIYLQPTRNILNCHTDDKEECSAKRVFKCIRPLAKIFDSLILRWFYGFFHDPKQDIEELCSLDTLSCISDMKETCPNSEDIDYHVNRYSGLLAVPTKICDNSDDKVWTKDLQCMKNEGEICRSVSYIYGNYFYLDNWELANILDARNFKENCGIIRRYLHCTIYSIEEFCSPDGAKSFELIARELFEPGLNQMGCSLGERKKFEIFCDLDIPFASCRDNLRRYNKKIDSNFEKFISSESKLKQNCRLINCAKKIISNCTKDLSGQEKIEAYNWICQNENVVSENLQCVRNAVDALKSRYNFVKYSAFHVNEWNTEASSYLREATSGCDSEVFSVMESFMQAFQKVDVWQKR